MNVTPEVLDWVRKAESDLIAAYHLAESEPPLPDQIGFFGQQTAEKYLKAFLIAANQTPPRTHDIEVLVELCSIVDPAFLELLPQVEGLSEFAVIFRYPGEWSDVASAHAAAALPESGEKDSSSQSSKPTPKEIEAIQNRFNESIQIYRPLPPTPEKPMPEPKASLTNRIEGNKSMKIAMPI